MSKRELPVLSRRDVIGLLAALPFAATCEGTESIERASDAAGRALRSGEPFEPRFFDEEEWEIVRMLVDLIIPADERSGSATDAGVPEFMDFMMIDRPGGQARMRDGLAWLEREARARFGVGFVGCDDAQRRQLLDAIAWPARAGASAEDGVRFFNTFRDLTASGFWTSEMGVRDLQYIGNVPVPEWTGCPSPALEKLGVSYERDWDS